MKKNIVTKILAIVILTIFGLMQLSNIVYAKDEFASLTDSELEIYIAISEVIDTTVILSDGTEYYYLTDNKNDEGVLIYAQNLKNACDEHGISVAQYISYWERANERYVDTTIVDNVLYVIFMTADSLTEEQTNASGSEVQTERKALEEKIDEKLGNGSLKDKTTAELLEIDALFKEYKEKYPASFEVTSSYYTKASDVSEEIKQRVRDGEDIGEYTTAIGEYLEEKHELAEEAGNLTNEASGTSATIGSSNANATHTLDKMLTEAQNFLSKAGTTGTIDEENLKAGSNTLYNILLGIGVFLAVAIGIFLGIKFMLSSAEDKAKVKEALIPYIAGCIVIFGAFTIWKLVISILAQIE